MLYFNILHLPENPCPFCILRMSFYTHITQYTAAIYFSIAILLHYILSPVSPKILAGGETSLQICK